MKYKYRTNVEVKWLGIRWHDNPEVWTCYKFNNLHACFDNFFQHVGFINYYDEKMDVLNVCLCQGVSEIPTFK